MTISNTVARYVYTGNGVTVAFNGPQISASDQIEVAKVLISTGARSVVNSSDYEVTSLDETNSVITFDSAPSALYQVVITRSEDIDQTQDLSNQTSFQQKIYEDAIDSLTRKVQMLEDRIGRALLYADHLSGYDQVLPEGAASQYLAWNSDGTAIINATAVDLTATTVSAFMQTVLDDANSAAALATLGAGSLATLSPTASIPSALNTAMFLREDGTWSNDLDFTSASPAITNSPMNLYLGLNCDNQGTSTDAAGFSATSGKGGTSVTMESTSTNGNQINATGGPLKLNGTGGSSDVIQVTATDATLNDILLGYRGVPTETQNANYTYVLADAGKGKRKTNTTPYAYTIPPNASVAFALGDFLVADNLGASADITLTQGAGVTFRLAGTSTTGNRTIPAYSYATARKVDTDTWLISGPGVT